MSTREYLKLMLVKYADGSFYELCYRRRWASRQPESRP